MLKHPVSGGLARSVSSFTSVASFAAVAAVARLSSESPDLPSPVPPTLPSENFGALRAFLPLRWNVILLFTF